MEYQLLREQVKDFIGDTKVVAACFFSYNFDSDFFENYILPLFVPEAPFSDNKIQNAILWRKYAKQLPKVSVICDFNAKGTQAPNLNYEVIARDMPRNNGHKPVFHCKQSYFLTNDERLLVINGSNNLTYSGWAQNIEGFSYEIFQNGEFFPRDYKDQYRGFINFMNKEYPANETIEQVKSFLFKTKYTDPVKTSFWDSGKSSFQDFIRLLISTEQIQEIEVLSPFIYGTGNLIHLKDYEADIRFSIPFEKANEIGIEKHIFDSYQSQGVHWSILNQEESSKDFRYNHSKIYRFKGVENMFTIIGSVNFTEMAWKGLKNGGNYENAVAYIEPISSWKDLLKPYNGDIESDFRFTEPKESEHLIDHSSVPKIEFILDWQSKTLNYINKEEYQCKWKLDSNNRMIQLGEGEFHLNSDDISQLLLNPAIEVFSKGNSFFYYPKQLGIEFKPLPANLRLNNEQLFQLWNELIQEENGSTELHLAAILRDKIEEAGEWTNEEQPSSILNQMSAHLSAIINLEKALFPKKIQSELVHYYLVVDNIDTIWGYLRCLSKEMDENKLQKGFCLLVHEIIRIKLFEKAIKSNLSEDIVHDLNQKLLIWKKETKRVRKMTTNVDEKLLKWTIKQL